MKTPEGNPEGDDDGLPEDTEEDLQRQLQEELIGKDHSVPEIVDDRPAIREALKESRKAHTTRVSRSLFP